MKSIYILYIFIVYSYIRIFFISYVFLQNGLTYFVGALLLYLNVLTQDVGTLLMRYKLLIFFVLGGALYILWAFTFLYQCANRSCKDIIYLFFLFHNYSYDMFYIFRCLLTQIAETKFIGSEIILFFVSCLFLGLT